MPTRDELKGALKRAAEAQDFEAADEIAGHIEAFDAENPQPVADEPEPPHEEKRSILENIGRFAEGALTGGGTFKDFQRGLEVISKDPRKAAELAEQQVRSMTAPVGGDYVAAAGSAVAGKGFNPDAQRARRKELEEEHGDLATMIPKGLGMTAAALRLNKVAPQLGVAGQGAAVSGGASLAEGDTLDKAAASAAIGAVGGKAIELAAKGVVAAAPSVARIAESIGIKVPNGKYPPGMHKLADVVKIPVRDLDAAFQELKAARGGRNPSIAEVVDSATRARLKPVVESQPAVATAAADARELGEVLRPQNLKAAVERTGPTGAVNDIEAAQKSMFDQVMNAHGNRAVDFNNPSFLNKRAVLQSIRTLAENADPQVRGILNNFQSAIAGGSRAQIRVRDVENIRMALSDAIKADPSLTEALRPVRERLKNIAGHQVTEYRDALQQYGVLGDFATGAQAGKKAVSGSTQEFRADASRANAPERLGQELGFRTKLSEDVGASHGRSTRAAEGMQDPAMLERAHIALPAGQADDLARVGQLEARAGRSLEEIDPSAPRSANPQDNLQQGMNTLAAISGGGAGFKANAIGAIFRRLQGFGMSRKAADGLASALFDPNEAQNAIATLQRIGKDREVLDEIRKIGASVTGAQSANNFVQEN